MNSIQPKTQNIAKNTTLLTGAYVIQKLFAFVYFTLIARFIGPEDVGKYVFAVSLTTLLAIFIDLGMTPVLIRETSKYQEKGSHYLGNLVGLKLILGLIAYASALILVYALHKDPLTISMVKITGLVMILDSFTLSFFGIFRAFQNLKYESISIIVNQFIIVLVGVAGLYLKFPIYILAWALFGGSLFSFIYSAVLIYKNKLVSLKISFSKPVLTSLLITAAPFALSGIFTRVYSYIDQVLLSILIGNKELGWYSVAYKITFALQFIPSAFAAALYPAMSRYFEHAPEKLSSLFEKSMLMLMIVSVPLAAGTFVITPWLITAVYGVKYLNSIMPLQILIIALPAIFLSFPVGSVLNSSNRQHLNTINLGLTMVINIILNIILIPKFHQIGASIAATISLYYLFLGNYYFTVRAIQVSQTYLVKKFALTLIASLIMAACVKLASGFAGYIASIAAGVLIYAILIMIFNVVNLTEIKSIFLSIVKKSAPEPEEPNV